MYHPAVFCKSSINLSSPPSASLYLHYSCPHNLRLARKAGCCCNIWWSSYHHLSCHHHISKHQSEIPGSVTCIYLPLPSWDSQHKALLILKIYFVRFATAGCLNLWDLACQGRVFEPMKSSLPGEGVWTYEIYLARGGCLNLWYQE